MGVQIYDTFDLAAAEISKQAELSVVCGALKKDGSPAYFVAPADVTDEQVRAKAFEIREGRPMEPYEKFLLDQAEAERRAREQR